MERERERKRIDESKGIGGILRGSKRRSGEKERDRGRELK